MFAMLYFLPRLFGVPCRDVYVALVNQIKAWRTRASCESGGENCLYEVGGPILYPPTVHFSNDSSAILKKHLSSYVLVAVFVSHPDQSQAHLSHDQ